MAIIFGYTNCEQTKNLLLDVVDGVAADAVVGADVGVGVVAAADDDDDRHR